MIARFAYLTSIDIQGMHRAVDLMMEVLEALDEGLIPDDSEYTQERLHGYLRSLVEGQRDSIGRTVAGSWAVAPDDAGMDSDARMDFIFRPTYIATATLSRALCEYPLLGLSIPSYLDALTTGLQFCSLRGLRGHGYEADSGAIDALRVLSLGRVPWLLNRHPGACADLKVAIDDVANDMAQRLIGGTATGMWGEDYSEGFRSAVETFRLKNDPDFMSSLQSARLDSSTLSKEDLPW